MHLEGEEKVPTPKIALFKGFQLLSQTGCKQKNLLIHWEQKDGRKNKLILRKANHAFNAPKEKYKNMLS